MKKRFIFIGFLRSSSDTFPSSASRHPKDQICLKLSIARPLVLLITVKVKISMDYWWNDIQRENRGTCRNTCPTATLPTILSEIISVYCNRNVQRNIVARSHNRCCSSKATKHSSVHVVELNVTVNYIQMLSVAQQCFYGKFVSPATIKHT